MNVNVAVFHDELRVLKRINPLTGIDMTAQFKKFFLALVTVALGAMSSGAMAISVTYIGIQNTSTAYNFSYDDGTNTTIYTLAGGGGEPASYPTNVPWFGNPSLASLWSVAPPNGMGGIYGSNFIYSVDLTGQNSASYMRNGVDDSFTGGGAWVVSTYVSSTPNAAAVPEIDGALIPQVGLLLAGLFIILGRRKENTLPMLAA